MKHHGMQARHLLLEHRWVLAGCGIILAVLVFAFMVLFSNVRAMIQNARHLTEVQLDNAISQTETLFGNYSRLCSILGANENVAAFSALSEGVPEDKLTLMGYGLQKELNSLVSVYGENINNLALYFPSVGSVVTMARNLHGEDVHLFWDNVPELKLDTLEKLPRGTWWNFHFAPNSDRSWIVHQAQTRGGQNVFVLIEYDLNSFKQSLAGHSKEMVLLTGNAQQCFFSSGPLPEDALWQQLIVKANEPVRTKVCGEKRFVLSLSSRMPDLHLMVMLPAGYIENIQTMFYLVIAVTCVVVLICLCSMAFYLNKRVFAPFQQLSQVGNYAGRDIQKTIRAVAEDFASMEHSRDYLIKERDRLMPLALGRSLVRLSESEKNSATYKQAASCLWTAGIAPEAGYALFAVTCNVDSLGFFLSEDNDNRIAPQQDLFYFLLNNILDDLLFQACPGVVAFLPDGWYAVVVSCEKEEQVKAINTVCEQLTEVYVEIFSATLISTNVGHGVGAQNFYDTVKELFRQTSFLQFWGSEQHLEKTTDEQLNFTNYCRLIRKLINRLGAQDYENIPVMMDDVLQQAASIGAEDIQITKKRIYAMTSILAITIDEHLSDEREFVNSLRLEERLYGAETISDFRRELKDILSALISHREANAGLSTVGNLMEEVRNYLLVHYAETSINVTTLSEQFNISVSYLSRSFKETYGVNLLEYIQRLRVDASKKILLDYSLITVAQQVGFWDTQALVRAFKKCEGVSPGEYKKMKQRQSDLPL